MPIEANKPTKDLNYLNEIPSDNSEIAKVNRGYEMVIEPAWKLKEVWVGQMVWRARSQPAGGSHGG